MSFCFFCNAAADFLASASAALFASSSSSSGWASSGESASVDSGVSEEGGFIFKRGIFIFLTLSFSFFAFSVVSKTDSEASIESSPSEEGAGSYGPSSSGSTGVTFSTLTFYFVLMITFTLSGVSDAALASSSGVDTASVIKLSISESLSSSVTPKTSF